MKLNLLMALMMLSPIFMPMAVADEMKMETFTANFKPDARFTERGSGYVSEAATVDVFNLTGATDQEVPINVASWPVEDRTGTYSGPIIQESVLEVQYVGVELDGTRETPYSFMTLGSIYNWSGNDIMNGAVNTTIRLPWVGDNYNFMSFRIYEVGPNAIVEPLADEMANFAVLSQEVNRNGTLPVVTGANATLIYENMLSYDWWGPTHAGEYAYYWPEEFHTWPWRYDPVPGAHTPWCAVPGDLDTCFGPYPYAYHQTPGSYDMKQVDDRYYVTAHVYLEPDQQYYFATSVILKNSTKGSMALSEEYHSGSAGGFNLIQGIYTGADDDTVVSQRAVPLVEAGWSFMFNAGHGAGLTGVHIPAEFNQTVEFRVHLDPADGVTDNFSVMLPLISESGEEFPYCIEIYAFDGDGNQQEWNHYNDQTESLEWVLDGCFGYTNHPIGAFTGNDLRATHFILYTAQEDGPSYGYSVPYVPGAGSEWYVIRLTLNPYLYGDVACTVHGLIPPCYHKQEYRLLGYQGDGHFMVSTTELVVGAETARRTGGSYYAYNLSFSASYTEGAWAEVNPDTGPTWMIKAHERRAAIAQARLTREVALLSEEGDETKLDLWSNAGDAWSKFRPDDPGTWGHYFDALSFTLTASIQEIWNGQGAMAGYIHGAFSMVADYMQQLGNLIEVYLGEILDTVVSIMVHIFDIWTEVLQKVLMFVGAIIFYFGLRLILLVTSYIKLAMAGRPFE